MSEATATRPDLTEVWNSRSGINWHRLLEEALTLEGSTSGIYERFASYSMGNQMLLHMQGVQEPVNTWSRWSAMNRHVLRGSKAYTIMVPLIYKTKDDDGEEKRQLRGFKLSNCLFAVSQTAGEDLPPALPVNWDKVQALGSLAISEKPYPLIDGNTQGISWGRNLALNPVAANPMKTWLHEASHIVAGHTTDEGVAEYRTHRGVMELEAEGSAYILVNELEITEQSDLAESRAYIQGWSPEAPESSIKRIFTTADTILRAGRLAVEGGDNAC